MNDTKQATSKNVAYLCRTNSEIVMNVKQIIKPTLLLVQWRFPNSAGIVNNNLQIILSFDITRWSGAY